MKHGGEGGNKHWGERVGLQMSCKVAHWAGKTNRISRVMYDLWFQKDDMAPEEIGYTD